MTRPLLVAMTVVALAVFLVSSWAERYHSRQFREHARTLSVLEDEGEIAQEVQRFSTDRRVDAAIELSTWGYLVAVVLWVLTAVLLIEGML